MTKKPRIGILTALGDFSPSYSLTGIVLDQARSLKDAGYEYALITQKEFVSEHKERAEVEGLCIRDEFNIYPQHKLPSYKPYERPAPDFAAQTDIFFRGDTNGIGLKDIVEPYDIVITHDLMFLDTFLPINQAIAKCAEEYPTKRWLHWIHSGPCRRPPIDEEHPRKGRMCYPTTLRFTLPPNSKIVFLNKAQKIDVARMYDTHPSNVRVAYNPKDIRSLLNFDNDTCEIIKRYDLFNHEIMQTYAFSTPRWREKGVDRLLKTFGEFKRGDVKVKLALINAHCSSEKDHEEVKALKEFASEVCCLEEGVDYFISSEYAHERYQRDDEAGKVKWEHWVHSAPYKVVQDLMAMSNIFIFPSCSEACSLIQAEASVSGKFMVLNSDFAPMLEFAPKGVLSYPFSRNDPVDHEFFYTQVAKEIGVYFLNDLSIVNASTSRNRTYNRDWIFKRQVEPLFYEGFSDGR